MDRDGTQRLAAILAWRGWRSQPTDVDLALLDQEGGAEHREAFDEDCHYCWCPACAAEHCDA